MKQQKVVVVDYGLGNLYSVKRALEVCGVSDPCVSDSPEDIANADKVILPGVGAFADGMKGLSDRALIEPLRKHAEIGRPLLGICLGMQMLASTSEEFGNHEGLNLIAGMVRPIKRVSIDGKALKVPHIGWSGLEKPQLAVWPDTILGGTQQGSAVYLVHSYEFEPLDKSNLLAYCTYGGHQISAVVRRGEIYGCQFHPEKSGVVGLKILERFLARK